MRLSFLPTALLALAAPAAALDAAPRTVEVDLSSFAFAPDTIRLHAGEAIVLHLVNTGGGGHDFSAPRFFAAATLDPADRARLRRGALEVPGHQSADLRLTVPAAGHYTLRCTHPLHSAFGMRGEIDVD
jgi:uncharacterized cupredoxin-like copper-binding protein